MESLCLFEIRCLPHHRLDICRLLLNICWALGLSFLILGLTQSDWIYTGLGLGLYFLQLICVGFLSRDIFIFDNKFEIGNNILLILGNLGTMSCMVGFIKSNLPVGIIGAILLGSTILIFLVWILYRFQINVKMILLICLVILLFVGLILFFFMGSIPLFAYIGGGIWGVTFVLFLIGGLIFYFGPSKDEEEWKCGWTDNKSRNLLYLLLMMVSWGFTGILIYGLVVNNPIFYWLGLGLYVFNILLGLLICKFHQPFTDETNEDQLISRSTFMGYFFNISLVPLGMLCSKRLVFMCIGGGIYGTVLAIALIWILIYSCRNHFRKTMLCLGLFSGLVIVASCVTLIILGIALKISLFWIIGTSVLGSGIVIGVCIALGWYFQDAFVIPVGDELVTLI